VKRFPRLSETFILNEFLELRRQGLTVELFAIMNPHEAHSQAEALALVPEVTYLQTGSLWRCAPSVLRAAFRHPLGTMRASFYTATRHSRPAARNLVHALVLVDRLSKGPPAHLHAHFMHAPAAIAYVANKVTHQPYSITGHAKDIYTTLPENLQRRCAGARFVTTCTEANRRFLVEDLGVDPRKVISCRHGVDLERFRGVVRHPVPGRVLSVGRLVPKKGFDDLIRAAGMLHRRGVPFELHLIGGGDLRPELTELAARESVADRVHFHGARPQTELLGEYGSAHVFALSPVVLADGDRDGIPNVLMEAMAAGVPLVATAVSGIPEIIVDDHSGRLVPPHRPDLVAAAIESLLGDAAECARLADTAQRYALDECGLSARVAPVRALFESVTTQSGTPAEASDRPASALKS
jgi:glycosyltransferase involved in cell wall biosynthesis